MIVERLCGRCELLLTNSEDIPLMSEGARHFQRLLGYRAARLRLRPTIGEFLRLEPVRLTALCGLATVVIVTSHFLRTGGYGEHAIGWLTALVAVRIASNRAGPATLAGAIAGLAIGLLHGMHDPLISLAYLLAGIVLDLELALVPRLTWNSLGIAIAGVGAMFATAIAPRFPTIGHHAPHHPWPLPPLVSAVIFGGLVALLGRGVATLLRRPTRPRAA